MIIDFDPTALGRPLTLRELEAIAEGRARVRSRYRQDGLPKSYKLNDEQRKIYDQTKVSGIVYDKPERVAWLSQWWLETTRQPILRVRLRGKLATVTMDLIACSRADGNMWDGTEDFLRNDTAQNAYAAARYAACEEQRCSAKLFSGTTRRFDQAAIRLLAETCVREICDDVVRWHGMLWQYDGLCYRQISRTSLKYEVWPMLGGVSHNQVIKLVREIVELLPEVKGESPQWVSHREGDARADRLIVRTNDIFDIREREACPASPRLFVRRRGAYDLVNALALAAGAHPRGWFAFGTYTSIERVPTENAAALARDLRELYWTVVGKMPPTPDVVEKSSTEAS